MSQIKKYISLQAAILLTVILLNAIIIKSIFINESSLYWLLILLIPLLYFLPFYFKKIKHYFFCLNLKNQLVSGNGTRSNDYIFNSDKNEDTGLKVLFGNNYCSQPYLSSTIGNEAIPANNNDDLLLNNLSVTGIKIFLKMQMKILKQ